jgi:hypothetical protein
MSQNRDNTKHLIKCSSCSEMVERTMRWKSKDVTCFDCKTERVRKTALKRLKKIKKAKGHSSKIQFLPLGPLSS